jgi:hypothetical protein
MIPDDEATGDQQAQHKSRPQPERDEQPGLAYYEWHLSEARPARAAPVGINATTLGFRVRMSGDFPKEGHRRHNVNGV